MIYHGCFSILSHLTFWYLLSTYYMPGILADYLACFKDEVQRGGGILGWHSLQSRDWD